VTDNTTKSNPSLGGWAESAPWNYQAEESAHGWELRLYNRTVALLTGPDAEKECAQIVAYGNAAWLGMSVRQNRLVDTLVAALHDMVAYAAQEIGMNPKDCVGGRFLKAHQALVQVGMVDAETNSDSVARDVPV
jgi:hypothetical protein